MIEYNDDDAHRRELSRKLQLLMDVVEANSGHRPPYKEIAAEIEAQGASMSRPRWGYMLGGNGPAVRDQRLLAALATYFGVPAEYLTDAAGNTDVPERVQAQLGSCSNSASARSWRSPPGVWASSPRRTRSASSPTTCVAWTSRAAHRERVPRPVRRPASADRGPSPRAAPRTPRRLSLPELTARAEAALGKPIHVRTTELPGDLSARLIQRIDHALLETRPGLSERSRVACVLHELAHVFMDDTGCDHQAYTGLLTGRTAFTRSLDTPHEQAVELVADQLALRIGLLDPEGQPGIFR